MKNLIPFISVLLAAKALPLTCAEKLTFVSRDEIVSTVSRFGCVKAVGRRREFEHGFGGHRPAHPSENISEIHKVFPSLFSSAEQLSAPSKLFDPKAMDFRAGFGAEDAALLA